MPAKKSSPLKKTPEKYNPKIVTAYFVEHKLPAPVTEYQFNPERKWRFDFAWTDLKVALEVEGLNGRHQTTAGFLGDMEKYNSAAALGWRVVRCINKNLCMQETVDLLKEMLLL